ncbi:MAG TPA: hypothetical protein DDZ51_10705 [Planctomycetaceae bacterium]|nr:hypothetical protein [Planctomycetaceae bacterium]
MNSILPLSARTITPFSARGNQVAVLIDFENVCSVGYETIGEVLQSLAKSETVAVQRGYGDWSRFPNARHGLAQYGVKLMELPSNSVGKNGADMQLTVDAIALAAVAPAIGKFVIIAGDRDFVALAQQLREWGCQVWGFGTAEGSAQWFKNACNRFETLCRTDNGKKTQTGKKPKSVTKQSQPVEKTQPVELSTSFISQVAWAIRAVQQVDMALATGAESRSQSDTLTSSDVPLERLFQMLRLFDSTFSAEKLVGGKNRLHIRLAERLQSVGVLELVQSESGCQYFVRATTLTRDHQNLNHRPLTYFAAIDEAMQRRSAMNSLHSIRPQQTHQPAATSC